MGKHAYCLMVHRDIEQVKALIQAIDHPDNDIFIHADGRFQEASLDALLPSAKFSKLHFYKIYKPTWGSFVQVETEIFLLRAATQAGRHDYYHLLSGQDFPLKNQDEIHLLFERNGGEFVHFSKPNEWERVIKERISTHRHPAFSSNNEFCRKLESRWASLNRRIGVNKLDSGIKYGFGAAWFSITDKLAREYCGAFEWIKGHFSHALCPDEHTLQSFILSFGYQDRLNHQIGDGSYRGCARYVDWSEGGSNPKVLGKEDILPLLEPSSPYCFARKLDFARNPELKDLLMKRVGGMR